LSFINTILMNAFSPEKELDDPALFAGRRLQVIELARNLHTRGTCPIIYGARGLGKSSLALQAQRIAMGDVTLLDGYGQREWVIEADDAFRVFYVRCFSTTKDTSAILQLVINSFGDITNGGGRSPSQPVDRTSKKRFSFKFFETETSTKYQVPEADPSYRDLTVEDRLLEMASRITQVTGQRILVIVDDLELVRDTTGLASFIKLASSDDLRFLLVGIGQSISNLVEDHQSIERIAVPIEIPRMQRDELSQIVDRAMARLADQGVDFTFQPSAREALARIASGFPWFVHVLGQSALIHAYQDRFTTVTTTYINYALRALVDNRFAQQYRDMYLKAVQDLDRREIVLRTLAIWRDEDIPVSDMYRVLRRANIANPSRYVSDLLADTYGPVLMRPPFQKRGTVRFVNEMFKVYIRVRRPIFDVHGVVRAAWQEEFHGTHFERHADRVL